MFFEALKIKFAILIEQERGDNIGFMQINKLCFLLSFFQVIFFFLDKTFPEYIDQKVFTIF